MAGARRTSTGTMIRYFFSSRVFALSLFSILFIFSLFSLFTSNRHHHPHSPSSAAIKHSFSATTVVRRSFLSLSDNNGDDHAILSLLRRQAIDHSAVAAAYAAFARRLKLSHHRLLSSFTQISNSLSNLSSRISSQMADNIDEEVLRQLEKELKDKIKLLRQLVAESKEQFDTQLKIQKLKDTVFAAREQLSRARRLGTMSSSIAASSTPKSLHCLTMRLLEYLISNPNSIAHQQNARQLLDQSLQHYAIFSDNVIAVSVVINSAARNSKYPKKLVFHVVTDRMYLNAMKAWFSLRPPPHGAHVDIRSVSEYKFLNSSYSPVVRAIENGRKDISLIKYMKFYLPELFPKLRKIVLLEDDVVVQRDLEGLWNVDLDGMVNGAVETCFGGFRRYSRYFNFSNSIVSERFSPRACAWAFGVNVFDLDAWRREQLTQQLHFFMEKNMDGALWNSENVLPAGLAMFYTTTKPLEKSWHVTGLGYNPSVSPDEIHNAAVIHYNGNMKPWLDVALNQYKNLWTRYVDTDMEFLQLCNFGV